MGLWTQLDLVVFAEGFLCSILVRSTDRLCMVGVVNQLCRLLRVPILPIPVEAYT